MLSRESLDNHDNGNGLKSNRSMKLIIAGIGVGICLIIVILGLAIATFVKVNNDNKLLAKKITKQQHNQYKQLRKVH